MELTNKRTLQEIRTAENNYIRSLGGLRNVPEACSYLNNIQREKIHAMKEEYGQSFIISLWTGDILTEYTGQTIYNFTGFWVVNKHDDNIIKLVQALRNNGKYDDKLYSLLADYIYNVLKGEILCWH